MPGNMQGMIRRENDMKDDDVIYLIYMAQKLARDDIELVDYIMPTSATQDDIILVTRNRKSRQACSGE